MSTTTMFSLVLVYSVVLGYLGVTMYLANQSQLTGERDQRVRTLLNIGVGFIGLLALYVLLLGASSSVSDELAAQDEEFEAIEISASGVLVSVVVCTMTGLAAAAVIRSSDVRQRIQRAVAGNGTYSPVSIVHTTAVVLACLMITLQLVPFLIAGGTETMAETIETQGISLGEPLFQAFVEIAAAFLGIGYAIRRTLPQALERLGLVIPTGRDWRGGFVGGLLLIAVLYAFSIAIFIFQSPETISEQNRAAESLAQAFATPLAALILSLSAAFGEEIFFRGALQPVFGNLITSVFFVAMHTQVFVTPGIILLFIVSMGLGYIRNRYSTTAAIIAHFVYNFFQLIILVSTGTV